MTVKTIPAVEGSEVLGLDQTTCTVVRYPIIGWQVCGVSRQPIAVGLSFYRENWQYGVRMPDGKVFELEGGSVFEKSWPSERLWKEDSECAQRERAKFKSALNFHLWPGSRVKREETT